MSATAVAVVVVLLVLLFTALVGAFIFLRQRRHQRRISLNQQRPVALPNSSSTTSLLRRSLPLLSSPRPEADMRITPFGTPSAQETPIFVHTPGANMRIATRRMDGAWDFGDPRDGFDPSGVNDLDNVPSPSPSSLRGSSSPFLRPNSPGAASTLSAFTFPPRRSSSPLSVTSNGTAVSAKEREARGYGGYGYSKKGGAFDEIGDEDIIPPPAYVYGHPHSDPHAERT